MSDPAASRPEAADLRENSPERRAETPNGSIRPRDERAAAKRLFNDPRPDGSMSFCRMQQLWEMAAGLPVRKVRVSEIEFLDDVCWFGGPLDVRPTPRAVAVHARDIYEADLSWPIILGPAREVLDGMHRLCRAWLEGIEEIDAVQLPESPVPRWRLLPTGEEIAISPETEETDEPR